MTAGELRERCIRYGADAGVEEMSFENRYLYRMLIDGSLAEEEFSKGLDAEAYACRERGCRKHSISIYGAPVVFSLKYDRKREEGQNGLRLLAEPGGTKVTIPQQINCCLEMLNQAAGDLSWNIAEDVNRIVSIIYPENGAETMNWLGGMWMGLDTCEKEPMLKLYMNLRHQTLRSRWQKIADVVVRYSEAAMEQTIRCIISGTQRYGNPIGIGVGIGKNGIMGLRIYLSFQRPEQDVWNQIYERFAPKSQAAVMRMIQSWQECFCNLPQSVMTFDFLIGKDRILLPEPVRLKTELSGCNLAGQEQVLFERFVGEQLLRLGFSERKWKEDLCGMKERFGSIFYQYASYGTSASYTGGRIKEHFTVYCEPDMRSSMERPGNEEC